MVFIKVNPSDFENSVMPRRIIAKFVEKFLNFSHSEDRLPNLLCQNLTGHKKVSKSLGVYTKVSIIAYLK